MSIIILNVALIGKGFSKADNLGKNMINCTQDQFIHLPHIMRIFLHQKAKVISMYLFRYFLLEDVLILIVRSITGTQYSVNVFHREVGIIMRVNKIKIRA